ncbi:hypothetical protein WR25_19235 [Diploscapter pachys]|uniref:Uncharacterized protein n=1 Tax=Diploscapter pachys TaxID=2018661 RepID=A0A2A2LY61_9BILA|nr:hypothetical protein WR25_19235 [Diploscapter pachys]
MKEGAASEREKALGEAAGTQRTRLLRVGRYDGEDATENRGMDTTVVVTVANEEEGGLAEAGPNGVGRETVDEAKAALRSGAAGRTGGGEGEGSTAGGGEGTRTGEAVDEADGVEHSVLSWV